MSENENKAEKEAWVEKELKRQEELIAPQRKEWIENRLEIMRRNGDSSSDGIDPWHPTPEEVRHLREASNFYEIREWARKDPVYKKFFDKFNVDVNGTGLYTDDLAPLRICLEVEAERNDPEG